MDDYKNVGNYYCSSSSVASTLKNTPFSRAFILKIDFALGSGFHRQTYIEYNTQKKAVRYVNNGEWTDYAYFSDDETLLNDTIRYMGTASFKDFNDCPNNTVWWVSSSTTENRPPVNERAYGQLISIGGFQLFFTYEYSNGIYSRWYMNGNWTAWLSITTQ